MYRSSVLRRVTLFIACSLDNYIARADGAIDWLFTEGDYGYKEFYDSIDTVLMGRKTYETSKKLGESSSGKTCYVFSRSERDSEAGNVQFASDPVNLTRRLVFEQGKGIFVEGGGEIVSALLNEDLIDEIVLSIHSILLGSGVPLFVHFKKQVDLKLLKSVAHGNGLVQSYYRVLKVSRL